MASSFRCPDGSNPFAGDAQRAADARSGSQRSPTTGHPVDTYEVHCKTGTVTVFIDMYGCSEYQRILTAKKSSVLAELERKFDGGEYPEVVRECELVFSAGKPLDAWSFCGALEPAALALLGDRRAIDIMRRTCEPMLPDGPKSDARESAVIIAMLALARGSKNAGPELDAEAASGVLIAFAEACQVDPREIVRRLGAESA